MEADRRKKARLAIDAMIRGLERDQVNFRYDEGQSPEAPAAWPSFAVRTAALLRTSPAWRTGVVEGEAAA